MRGQENPLNARKGMLRDESNESDNVDRDEETQPQYDS